LGWSQKEKKAGKGGNTLLKKQVRYVSGKLGKAGKKKWAKNRDTKGC